MENKDLFDQFMTIHQQLAALRHKIKKDRGPLNDKTQGQGRVLALLQLHDGVSTKDMATILGIRVSSLNETLAKMEEAGLVVREQSEEDKRIMLVNLTEEGRNLKQEALDVPALLFGVFDETEQETLAGYFTRMTDALNDELGEEGQAMLEEMRERRKEFMERANEEGDHDGHEHGGHGHGKRGFDDGPRGGRRDGGPRGSGKRDGGRGGRGSFGGPRGGGRGGRGGHGGDRGGHGGRGGFGGERGGRRDW